MKAPNHPSRRRSSAFTLVEMLVVVAIIAIMLAVAGAFFRTDGGSRAIHAASRELQTLVESARMRALSSGNQTALLIFNKSEDMERYLRFVIVVERRPQKSEATASPSDEEGKWEWVPVGNGSFLAKGAFYWPKEGTSFVEPFSGDGQFNLGSAFSSNKGDWIGLLFTPQGMPVGRGTLEENPVFIIAKGEVSSSGLDVSPADKNRCDAFMIQRSNGRIVPVESPVEQLNLD